MRSARRVFVLLAALSAAVLLDGRPVSAAEGGSSGPYIRAFGGYSFVESPAIQGDGISNGATGFLINRGDMDTSGGGWGGLSGGYRWGMLRLEGMGTYESHKVTSFTSPQFQYRDNTGTFRSELNAQPSLDGSPSLSTKAESGTSRCHSGARLPQHDGHGFAPARGPFSPQTAAAPSVCPPQRE